MDQLKKTGSIFYGLAIAGVGIHQLFYADFCPFIFPAWPNPFDGYNVLADVVNVHLIITGGLIVLEKNIRTVSLILGGLLLAMLLFAQVPYEYIVIPYSKTNLGLWILPLKELALAGGAFCIAGAFATAPDVAANRRPLELLAKLIPFGRFFFCTTMILFGISHFKYSETVANMVPAWIPGHDFWCYFAGIALIAGGVAIAINVWLRPAALLMGSMILIWFVALHIPDAMANPFTDKGNEITAAFSALAFSGIAFVIAASTNSKTS